MHQRPMNIFSNRVLNHSSKCCSRWSRPGNTRSISNCLPATFFGDIQTILNTEDDVTLDFVGVPMIGSATLPANNGILSCSVNDVLPLETMTIANTVLVPMFDWPTILQSSSHHQRPLQWIHFPY